MEDRRSHWSKWMAAVLLVALWSSYLVVVIRHPVAAVGLPAVGRWLLVAIPLVITGEPPDRALTRWALRDDASKQGPDPTTMA